MKTFTCILYVFNGRKRRHITQSNAKETKTDFIKRGDGESLHQALLLQNKQFISIACVRIVFNQILV